MKTHEIPDPAGADEEHLRRAQQEVNALPYSLARMLGKDNGLGYLEVHIPLDAFPDVEQVAESMAAETVEEG